MGPPPLQPTFVTSASHEPHVISSTMKAHFHWVMALPIWESSLLPLQSHPLIKTSQILLLKQLNTSLKISPQNAHMVSDFPRQGLSVSFLQSPLLLGKVASKARQSKKYNEYRCQICYFLFKFLNLSNYWGVGTSAHQKDHVHCVLLA